MYLETWRLYSSDEVKGPRVLCYMAYHDEDPAEADKALIQWCSAQRAAGDALLAVVRAARKRSAHCQDGPCADCDSRCDVGEAIAALDKVEV